MSALSITTVKTAHVRVGGAYPTLGELRTLITEANDAHIPDSATVRVDQSQAVGIATGSVTVTWTASVEPARFVEVSA